MPDTTVKYFDSTMSGAPAIPQTAGSLIPALDACLVNGFGSVTLDSLVIASNVATGTISTGHNFAMMGTVGPVITIAGATPSGLNGEWRLASVPGSTTFTFATSGISDQTATGTITAKRAPAGFEKVFSGTNKAVYRSLDITSTQLYLRVVDDAIYYSLLAVYETMSDVDTGTGPSTGTHYFVKNWFEGNRPWRIVADPAALYVFSANGTSNTLFYGMFYAGDIVPILSSDAYHHLLIGHPDYANYDTTQLMGLGSNNRNGSIARSHSQVDSAIVTTRQSHVATSGTIGYQSSVVTYPNAAGSEFLSAPVEVWTHTETILRGWMPGLYNPLHPGSGLTDGALIAPSVGGLPGRTLQITRKGNDALSLDLTGPWR